jgi:hypothetical protein
MTTLLNDQQSPVDHTKPSIHWPSIWQFGFALLGILFLWSGALGLAGLGLVEKFSAASTSGGALSIFLLAAGFGLVGLLLFPSAGYALARILGKKIRLPGWVMTATRPSLLIFAFPFLFLLGVWIAGNNNLSWILLPPIHVLVIGLPILWLAYLGWRNLPLGSAQRAWGVFGGGLVIGPTLIMLAEVGAMIAGILIIAVYVSSQPVLANEVSSLIQRLAISRSNPEAAIQALKPYLMQPGVLLAMITFWAVIVPLIEELIKPIGVWLLFRQDITPAAGFAAGVLSGAGYALMENLLASSSGVDWSILVLVRVGTAVIHILNTGLSGWALALAWKEGRYLRLGFTYLIVVSIHGLWNALTLFSGVASLQASSSLLSGTDWLTRLGSAAPFGLGILTLGAFMILLRANHLLRYSV